jgi:hypothetical protein
MPYERDASMSCREGPRYSPQMSVRAGPVLDYKQVRLETRRAGMEQGQKSRRRRIHR